MEKILAFQYYSVSTDNWFSTDLRAAKEDACGLPILLGERNATHILQANISHSYDINV